MENKKNTSTSITKTVELRNYAYWKELYNLSRELLDTIEEPTNASAASLSYLSDFSNSILKDLEKLEE